MFELDRAESFLSRNVEIAGPDHICEWLSLALQSAEISAYKWDLQTNVVTRAKDSYLRHGQEHSFTPMIASESWQAWQNRRGMAAKSTMSTRDFVTLQDITEQKNYQDLISQKEQQLSLISNRMPQLVWIADNTGALTWINDRVVEFSGIPASELLGWGYLTSTCFSVS